MSRPAPEASDYLVHKACPSCRHENSIIIDKNALICQEDGCGFSVMFCCPICDHNPQDAQWISDTDSPHPKAFVCTNCRNLIPLQKVQYMIDNAMVVDSQHRCTFCNGPTIHRSDMNIAHRCFFFPKCSGQIDLFGTVKESLVFLDFETTGLEYGRDSIIEIGALKIDEDGYEHTFQSFVRPTLPPDAHITQITGITPEMLEGAPELNTVLGHLMEFVGSAKIVAHNAEFDIPWLLTALIKHQFEIPEKQVICTLNWARKSGEGHCSLGALSKKYAIRHHNAHRALADAVSTKELFFVFEGFKKSPRPETHFKDYLPMAKRAVEKYPAPQ